MKAPSIHAAQSGSATSPQARHVIVIEDDDATRESCVALLRAIGYEVLAYPSCEEFLADGADANPGCLLLDHHFDGMTGLDLLASLAERGNAIPAVLYTGRMDSALRRRLDSDFSNVVGVVEKPLGGRHLTDALARAFDVPPQVPD